MGSNLVKAPRYQARLEEAEERKILQQVKMSLRTLGSPRKGFPLFAHRGMARLPQGSINNKKISGRAPFYNGKVCFPPVMKGLLKSSSGILSAAKKDHPRGFPVETMQGKKFFLPHCFKVHQQGIVKIAPRGVHGNIPAFTDGTEKIIFIKKREGHVHRGFLPLAPPVPEPVSLANDTMAVAGHPPIEGKPSRLDFLLPAGPAEIGKAFRQVPVETLSLFAVWNNGFDNLFHGILIQEKTGTSTEMQYQLDAEKKSTLTVSEVKSMNDEQLKLLNEIYHETADGRFTTMYALETITGLTGAALRPLLEDLKDARVIVEHEEGFQVSRHGLIVCRTRWD